MADEPPTPPADAEDWTDEQWLELLKATDAAYPEHAGNPRITTRWRDRPGPQLLGAAMLGLRDAIYGHPDDEPVVVVEAPGGPPDDDQPEVHLDPEYPERSEVIVRRSQQSEEGNPPTPHTDS
jgi:hypothetical protein